MRLFLDECVSDPTGAVLREANHDVTTVRELGRSSAPNGEILSLARQRRAVLVTTDQGLGDLRKYPLGTHGGIIVLKIGGVQDVEAVHRHLLNARKTTHTSDLAGSLLIVDRTKSRLRRPA